MSKLLRPFLFLGVLALLSGCPDQGVVCTHSLSRCGTGCSDFQSDVHNCGACGIGCQARQLCQAGACVCEAGATSCADGCAVLPTDANNCGACGHACAATQVCEAGACRTGCSAATAQCGQSCVDLMGDPSHCGACGFTCENAQSCHRGRCSYDVVAACFTSGELTGLQEGSSHKGPNLSVGAGPASLAVSEDVLLVADGTNQTLYQARLAPSPAAAVGSVLTPFSQTTAIGAGANHLLVEGDYVYVANSFGETLQILKRTPPGTPDGGQNPNGLTLTTVGELNFGPNTTPEAVAKIGHFAYVPLYGSFGAAASAGQKVARVDVSNPTSPAVTGIYDLSTLDLHPFSHDAGSSIARPSSIAALGGILYVTLNNLGPDYSVQGPGLLARIDPVSGAVTTVSLGDSCLNPVWVSSDGDALYVSCAGRTDFSTTAEKTGVVALRNDLLVGSWAMGCADAGTFNPSSGSGCRLPISGRLAVRNKQVYVADQNGGRVFVLSHVGNALVERKGYAGTAGGPVQACGFADGGTYSNVGDVVAVP